MIAISRLILGLYKFGKFSRSGEFFRDEMVLIWHRNFSTCSLDFTNRFSKQRYTYPYLAHLFWLDIADFLGWKF